MVIQNTSCLLACMPVRGGVTWQGQNGELGNFAILREILLFLREIVAILKDNCFFCVWT